MLVSGFGSLDKAIQNSPCVNTVSLALREIVASAGIEVVMPNVPTSLKALIPKPIPSDEAEMPKDGMPVCEQSPDPLVSTKSGLLELATTLCL